MNSPKYFFDSFDDRPFIYTSLVMSMDGKIQVHKPGYWPIGSDVDLEHFIYLRSKADVILAGRNTAMKFGCRTIDRIHGGFEELRNQEGKTGKVEYAILTSNPDEQLVNALQNSYGYKPMIFSNNETIRQFNNHFRVEYLPSESKLDPVEVSHLLFKKGLRDVFLDGGPGLLIPFLKAGLVDEIFLTIAPKIIGDENGSSLTMVEGYFFPADKLPIWNLLSSQKVGDEVFLRYRRDYASTR
jgi:riboflavin biosynthesis pyrimidine reductase